jgi:glycosyltransferase involved in cell wall biosynthesis
VTLVRDEVDIIAFTIAHLISQGVDRVVVADNDSSDGTTDLLQSLSISLPITLVVDREFGYYQSWKITRLARYAPCSGAQWVIPFDADELWVAPGTRLRDFLLNTDLDVVKASMMDYVPQVSDDNNEPNPYLRIRHHVADVTKIKKVAFRAHPLARVAVGNHAVRHPGRAGDGLEIRHFPSRSREQLRRKVDQGANALAATDHPQEIGAHWRLGAQMTDDQLASMYGSEQTVVLDPAPYTGHLK